MKRIILNLVVDTFALVSLIWVTATALLLYFRMPPGSGHHFLLLGLSRHQWGTVHFCAGLTFLALIIIHIILHWRWIAGVCGDCFNSSKQRTLAAAVILTAVILIATAPFLFPLEQTEAEGRHFRRGHEGSPRLFGTP